MVNKRQKGRIAKGRIPAMQDTLEALYYLKKPGQTYDDVLRMLLDAWHEKKQREESLAVPSL